MTETEEKYPRDLLENKRYRAKIKLRCDQSNSKKRAEARAFYYQKCKEDILFFFNVFLWTYDPRLDGVKCHLPFITYEFQDEYLLGLEEAYKNGKDHLTEKSRDMGASWMVLGWMFWHWLFDPSFQGLVGSRKEDLVDNGQLDSLFGKFDYMVDRLPKWMAGEEYYENKKSFRSHMKLVNPRNKNALLGESANRDFSRQGRYSAILLDEFAFWEHGSNVWKATGDSTKSRIVVSTSDGMGNKFYELVKGIQKGELKIKKARLHWKLHPLKDDAWYQEEKSRRTPVEIAQEIDISYENSVKGRVYDNFTREQNVLQGLDYDPNLHLFVSWDFGIGNPTAIIWLQKDFDTNHVFVIDYYERDGKEIGFFVPFITGKVDSGIHRYTQEELDMIKRHSAWGPARHFGDPTGGSKQQVTGRSVISHLADEGIYVNTDYKKFKITARYQDTYRLIPRLYVSPKCEEFIDAILNSRWNLPDDEFKQSPMDMKPLHDWTSHARTALEYFAVNEPRKEAKERKAEREQELKRMPAKYRRGAMWTRSNSFKHLVAK